MIVMFVIVILYITIISVCLFFDQVFESEGLTLKGILETHFHADFVSGHYELMERTGAKVYFGPGSKERTKFTTHELKHNEVRCEYSSNGLAL